MFVKVGQLFLTMFACWWPPIVVRSRDGSAGFRRNETRRGGGSVTRDNVARVTGSFLSFMFVIRERLQK